MSRKAPSLSGSVGVNAAARNDGFNGAAFEGAVLEGRVLGAGAQGVVLDLLDAVDDVGDAFVELPGGGQ